MVFYYSIRGGKCLNQHSHITLTPQDIICYVGRDKHENEHLIKYGWPGDIWFHVDRLSSAHVYFRLKNVGTVSSIPIDDLPADSVYDMMQICKNNSISGCKLASCKMVYTPHSNLKKAFDMEAGAVTYHDTKWCRYGRCDKDRTRVKELEKTKSDDVKVDYFQEMKDNERRIIERKKKAKRRMVDGDGDDDLMYDPIREDEDLRRTREGRQGDAASGLDAGLDALEGISFSNVVVPDENGQHQGVIEDERPTWIMEKETRRREPLANVQFLRERGYSSSEAMAACQATAGSKLAVLSKIYNATSDGDNDEWSSAAEIKSDVPEEVVQARMEEKEVLLAMFGFADEDDELSAKFSDIDDTSIFDVSLPITGYEPPERYYLPSPPPQLMIEVYVDNGMAPMYPNAPPVLAFVGGGLPESRLKELTHRVKAEALRSASEDPGEPQIFNLLSFAAEAAEDVVRKEGEKLEEIKRTRRLEAEKAAAAARKDAQEKAGMDAQSNPSGGSFASEADRRAYAMAVAAKAAISAGGGVSQKSQNNRRKAPAPKYNAKTGINDRDLCKDLFS
mmetsp:Transcript_31537/g.76286  ORF Transcript_31537/g.76286 Transcript_31537/m.76286 type:complete len:562 (-) Transcript_31537:227-1912(-)